MNNTKIITETVTLDIKGQPTTFAITINVTQLAFELGVKAMRNTRKITKLGHGAIVVMSKQP